jgi:glycine cleavage system H protein
MANEVRMLATHEWARLEGDVAVVGITPYAVSQLGDVVYVELPEVDAAVSQGVQFGEIESVKAASELIAPMSGKVVAANGDLEDNYDAIADDPFGKGWMIKIEIDNPDEFQELMSSEEYEKTCD